MLDLWVGVLLSSLVGMAVAIQAYRHEFTVSKKSDNKDVEALKK